MARSRIFASIVLSSTLLPLGAQTPSPKVGETIEVSIVNVDVIVADRRGNHIRGLTAADFEVRDNGVVQPITNFSEYDDAAVEDTNRVSTAGTPVAPPKEIAREKRTIVLFVERQVLPPAEADKFVASMKKLMHDILRSGDSAAVVSFHYASHVQQKFTDDAAKIDAAIDKLRPMFDRVPGDVESQMIRNQYLQELLDEDAAAAGQAAVQSVVLSGIDEAERELLDMRRKVQTLNMLVNTMAAIEGRKAVLMATRRFSQYAGYEYMNLGLQPPKDDHFNTREIRDALARNANAAGVTFYPVYPQGYVNIPIANVEQGPRNARMFYSTNADADANKLSRADGILLNETKSIGDLADRTGGVAGWGLSDVQKIANVVREDLTSYYSLAFSAPSTASTHNIRVTTKNRSYVVRARREFVEKTDEMQMADRVVAAMYQPQRAADLPIEVQVLRRTKKGRRFHIPIVLRIPASSLATQPTDKFRGGSFRVYAAAGGALGIMSDVYQKSQPFTVPYDAKDIDTKQFTYEFEMVTDGRADRIVVGACDELRKECGLVRVKLDALTAPSPTNR